MLCRGASTELLLLLLCPLVNCVRVMQTCFPSSTLFRLGSCEGVRTSIIAARWMLAAPPFRGPSSPAELELLMESQSSVGLSSWTTSDRNRPPASPSIRFLTLRIAETLVLSECNQPLCCYDPCLSADEAFIHPAGRTKD